MTVIKAFNNEKKPIDIEPLVGNAVPPAEDVEARAGSLDPNGDPHMLMMKVRAKRASTITTLLLIATSFLVLTIGICGGFYIYKQFVHARSQRYKAYCNIPYYAIDDDQFNNNHIVYQDKLTQDSDLDFFNKEIAKSGEDDGNMMSPNVLSPFRKEFREEFELDLKSGDYEKIHVPEFEKGRNSKFVHDFHSNMTGIIDLENEKCFVMPLNRTTVLPPTSLLDLIQKMWLGYYNLNPDQLSESYVAVGSPIEDIDSLGKYIFHECQDFPVYRLEKVAGGIVKRSVDGVQNKAFTVLDGMQARAIQIINIDNLEPAAVV